MLMPLSTTLLPTRKNLNGRTCASDRLCLVGSYRPGIPQSACNTNGFLLQEKDQFFPLNLAHPQRRARCAAAHNPRSAPCSHRHAHKVPFALGPPLTARKHSSYTSSSTCSLKRIKTALSTFINALLNPSKSSSTRSSYSIEFTQNIKITRANGNTWDRTTLVIDKEWTTAGQTKFRKAMSVTGTWLILREFAQQIFGNWI